MTYEDRAKQRIHDIAHLFVNGSPKPTLCWANTAVYYIAGEFDLVPTVAQQWFQEAFTALASRRRNTPTVFYCPVCKIAQLSDNGKCPDCSGETA